MRFFKTRPSEMTGGFDPRIERFAQPLVPMGADEERIRTAIRDILATIPNCTCHHTVNAHQRTEVAGVRGFYGCGAVACQCIVYVPDNQDAQASVVEALQTQNKALTHMLELVTDAMNASDAKVRAFESALTEEDDYQAEERTKAIVKDVMNDAALSNKTIEPLSVGLRPERPLPQWGNPIPWGK